MPMRALRLLLIGVAAIAAQPALGQAPGETSAVPDLSCDRACLLGKLGAYMAALEARNAIAVPAAPDILFVENNVALPLGEGIWRTVTDVDDVGLEVADPLTGNAAWFGSVREHGAQVMFAVRIHVRNGLIDEAESVAVRRMDLTAPARPARELVHDPAFYEILPAEQRRARERMIAIADSYFDTVEYNDGQVFAPFSEDCSRLENGMSTTSKADPNGSFGAVSIVEGCEAQFELGIYRINKRVRERRYPLVDEERGIVVASGFFDHANEFDRYRLTDGREMETALKWPNTVNLLEAFRIKDGEIQRIEAVFTYAPYFAHNPFAGPAAAVPDHPPAPDKCDDSCLTRLTRQVMAAYITKDWRSLPWAETVGYTDENLGLQVGEGIWGTITAIDERPLILADAQTGQAVWVGRIEEHGQPAWAAITVEAAGDRIGGVHTLVHRQEYGPPWAEPGSPPPFPALPATRRTSRIEMLAAVDRFHSAVNAHDGKAPPGIGSACIWAINGQETGSCSSPLEQNRLRHLARIRDVRLLAVDEARGLVAVSTFEDYPASPRDFTDAAGKPYSDPGASPRTLRTVQIFRFEAGELQRIEAFTLQLPYGRTRP
jgi:hypothetical protein